MQDQARLIKLGGEAERSGPGASVIRWTLDHKGHVAHRDPEWFDFTGLNETDQRSQIRTWAVHPDDVPHTERLLEEAYALQAPFILTYRLRRPDQSFRWVMSGASPSLSPMDGEFLGYFGETKLLTSPEQAGGIYNLLSGSGAPLDPRQSILALDAIAEHVLIARNLARHSHQATVTKTLDFVLSNIGALLQQAKNQLR